MDLYALPSGYAMYALLAVLRVCRRYALPAHVRVCPLLYALPAELQVCLLCAVR